MDSQQSDSYILCANGCGFFATTINQNLCSKCFREKFLNSNVVADEISTKKQQQEEPVAVSSVQTSSDIYSAADSGSKKKKNRCLSCDKRVGLTGFQCRCGSTFCCIHRYPESHECSFDFKALGRVAVAKANPLVKAEKLHKF